MNSQSRFGGPTIVAFALMLSPALCASASARGGSHGGGSGAGHVGGFGFHGGNGSRGFGGFHRGYGYSAEYRGGYGSWRGGSGYDRWGWSADRLFLSTLPLYYSTLWWDGMPYYYADDNYYQWNGFAGEYETVTPPVDIVDQATAPPTVSDLFAYPKSGQSPEKQAQDKQGCRNWATGQTGFDPHNWAQRPPQFIQTHRRRRGYAKSTCELRRRVLKRVTTA